MDKSYAQYLQQKTKEDYDLIAGDFGATRRFAWDELFPLARYVKPGDKVLDMGCGNGRLLQIFKDVKIDYIGVDNSGRLIEMAKKQHPGNQFQVAEALDLPFKNDSFDVIYSVAVFHHIPSKELRELFLKEARRVLKNEGTFILTVWNLWQKRGWKYNLKYFTLGILGLSKLDFKDVLVPWGKTCQRYIHAFTKKEIKKVCQQAGFEVKEIGVIKRQQGRASNILIVLEK